MAPWNINDGLKYGGLLFTISFCYLLIRGNKIAKTSLAIFLIFLVPSCFIPLFLLRPRNPKNTSLMAYVTFFISRCYGLEFKVRGKENMPENVSGIVVMNHQNFLDTLTVIELSPHLGKIVSILKKELLLIFPFGPAVWLCGGVFIKRNNPSAAYKTLKAAMQELKEDHGRKFLFYPEGTRNKDILRTGQFLTFKKGAFKMAIDGQVPIFPIVHSPYYFCNNNEFKKGVVISQILPPIETKGLTEKDVDDLSDRTNKVMQEAFNKLYEEIIGKPPQGE